MSAFPPNVNNGLNTPLVQRDTAGAASGSSQVAQQLRNTIFSELFSPRNNSTVLPAGFGFLTDAEKEAYEKAEQATNEKREEILREAAFRAKEFGLGGVANNISRRVYDLFITSRFYALRNDLPRAMQLVFNAFPVINEGFSSLSGSAVAGLPSSFLSGLSGFYNGLLSSANDVRLQTMGIQPTDDDLLRLIGRDRLGRDERQFRQDMLANLPLATTPMRTFESAMSFLLPSASSPAGLGRVSTEVARGISGSR